MQRRWDLAVDGFEGPLDWWLEMARAQEIVLANLSIATLIGSFVTAMDTALATRTGDLLLRWAVWTVMAATLTELWSQLLLPTDAPAARAAVEEAEALRRQLLDRARMRAAADWLERRMQLGRDVFRRGRPDVSAASRGGDLTELLGACLPALQVRIGRRWLSGLGHRGCGPPATCWDSFPRCWPRCQMAVRPPPSCRRSRKMYRRVRCVAARRWPVPRSPAWNARGRRPAAETGGRLDAHSGQPPRG